MGFGRLAGKIMKNIIDKIIEKWDWWIYGHATKSIKRMCESNAGFAYLFSLYLSGWMKIHPISDELKRSTELFYESLMNLKE
jgi:hypothetical protein